MPDVVKVRAATNNEVAFLSWDLDGMIPGCLGFEIVRLYPDTGEERCLASWVPFKGQRNPRWIPQDTGVWPVQKTFWRDLTVRRRRDSIDVRPDGEMIAYRVRPVGDMKAGLDPVPVRPDQVVDGKPAYTGPARPLGYLGQGAVSPPIFLGQMFGKARVAFTNGVLSTQWMSHALAEAGIKVGQRDKIRAVLQDPTSKIRAYLHGDVPDVLTSLLKRAKAEGGTVRLALYELGDDELCDAIIAARDVVEVILSNSGRDDQTKAWDAGNAPYRKRLHDAGVVVTDRLFNNNHIGHNKFAVYRDIQGNPQAVMTGSTNWTSTGICGQSNNAFVRDDPAMAEVFDGYWERMKADGFPPPASESAAGHVAQTQGVPFRKENHMPNPLNGASAVLDGMTVWFSPNDPNRNKKDISVRPVDLQDVFARIKAAKRAVLFLVFNPSLLGENSIVDQAVAAAKADPNLIVQGAISDETAMPNYVAPTKDPVTHKSNKDGKSPFVYPEKVWEAPNVSIVRAANLTGATIATDFQAEVLTVGHAIVHDKIVIIDPMEDNATVITGSHNLGYKASYENDENLVIVEGDKTFAAAYAVHMLDVFDHYKFRAWRRTIGKGPSDADGIAIDDKWLKPYADGKKGAIARYFP
ncbi:phospholipase D-like domain-containing protein [Mesorhizobium sp. ESP6-5]|uniref:phospholipase D-like domain-containing protein n=1 Tax=Mesorhizobium sp. ESP6-5 TaxID=2876623 RepID=UPI001CCD4BB5|nr:phospholipase D-like domain-containing protein [Mesorhizobium sp. ESP6-5]MBZ9753762.1 phospholipase D-like domain-containing protein [Mesorhizobium sp. ESP6-5]